MAWTPLYQLKSIEKLCLNLLAIYDRDQFEALQWVSPELAPFRYFGNARRVDQSDIAGLLCTSCAPVDEPIA